MDDAPMDQERQQVLSARLMVDVEFGAGIEVSFLSGRGYEIECIAEEPGQPGLLPGDVIVAISHRSVALSSESAADEVLAEELNDGAEMLIHRRSAVVVGSIPDDGQLPSAKPEAATEQAAQAPSDRSSGAELDPPCPDDLSTEQEGPCERTVDTVAVEAHDAAPPAPPQALEHSALEHEATLDRHAPEAVVSEKRPPDEATARRPPEAPAHSSPEHEAAPAHRASEAAVPEERPRPPDKAVDSDEQSADDGDDDEELLLLTSPPLPRAEASAPPSPCAVADAGGAGQQGESLGPPDGEDDDCLVADVPLPFSLCKAEVRPLAANGVAGDAKIPGLGGSADVGDVHLPPGLEKAPHCKIADLQEWLEDLHLLEYLVPATQWCSDMGAVSFEEVAENIGEFAEDVGLKPIERQRVQKWATSMLRHGDMLQARGSGGGSGGGLAPMRCPPAPADDAPSPSMPSRGPRGPMHDETFAAAYPGEEEPGPPPGMGSAAGSRTAVLASRTVRLAMDSSGSTGLALRWDEEWGIVVTRIDPLPGQVGMREGDFIVAIDGCSLRHRTHSECDAVFAERLRNGALLTVVSPSAEEGPGQAGRPGFAAEVASSAPAGRGGKGRPGPMAVDDMSWQRHHGGGHPKGGGWGGKGRRGGYDAQRMWSRFRPVW